MTKNDRRYRISILPDAITTLSSLTLARFPYFATFASGGMGAGATPPPSGSGENSGLLSTSIRDWSWVFDPRSIFDPVLKGQGSNFRKIDNFSTLHAYISKTKNRSDLKHSPACSSFNSKQDRVLL